ncbi:MAG: hypothetical protein KDC44_06335 [Phaeodactylibacter sp.]|nr:hypothetical protein [Phaeodactylibacter sp.]
MFWGALSGLMLLLAVQEGQAQDHIWRTLSKITYKKQYDEMVGFDVSVPVFSADVQALAGQEVTVRGYIIPTEGYESQTNFVFSAFPYNMCFFCGGAGPETVMEVYAEDGIEFTAQAIRIRGTLRLNDSDINRLMYALEGAELVQD